MVQEAGAGGRGQQLVAPTPSEQALVWEGEGKEEEGPAATPLSAGGVCGGGGEGGVGSPLGRMHAPQRSRAQHTVAAATQQPPFSSGSSSRMGRGGRTLVVPGANQAEVEVQHAARGHHLQAAAAAAAAVAVSSRVGHRSSPLARRGRLRQRQRARRRLPLRPPPPQLLGGQFVREGLRVSGAEPPLQRCVALWLQGGRP